jgi:hypothetical protein
MLATFRAESKPNLGEIRLGEPLAADRVAPMKPAICGAGVLLALAFAFTGCDSGSGDRSKDPTTNEASSGNPLTAPADYLGAAAKAKKVSEKTIDLVSVDQAVQLFYAGEGRFPKDLNELVTEKYLPQVPVPPHGMKLNYNPANGKVSIVAAP